LHNPANDRRTTKGSFHIAEGGLPIPGDKKAVPKITYARLLNSALNPPEEIMSKLAPGMGAMGSLGGLGGESPPCPTM